MVTKLPSTSAAGSLVRSPALARVREVGLVLTGMLSLTLIGQITIPLPFTPVPIIIGTFAALGADAALGSCRGALLALLPGALAVAGAPVLAGWSGSTVVTFGYVTSYILIAAIAGCVVTVWSYHSGSMVVWVAAGVALMLLASTSVYIPGLIWFKVATGAG